MGHGRAVVVCVLALTLWEAGLARGSDMDLSLNWASAGSDFQYGIFRSPFTPSARFGYSVACQAKTAANNVAAVAISAYEANGQAGAVAIVSGADLARCRSRSDCAPTLIIDGPPLWRASVAVAWQRIKWSAWYATGGWLTRLHIEPPAKPAPWEGHAWFGHEVDLRDVDGDGLPELAIGARFENELRGAVYVVSGTVLQAQIDAGRQRVDINAIQHRAFRPSAAREFGFSLSLVPRRNGHPALLIASQHDDETGVAGSGSVGVVDLDAPGQAVTFASPPDKYPERRFAYALDYDERADRMLYTAYSSPTANGGIAWEAAPARPTAAQPYLTVDSDASRRHRHFMGQALYCPAGRMLLAAATTQTMPPSGQPTLLLRAQDEHEIAIASKLLLGSNAGWSQTRPLDLNHDGVPEYITSAAYLRSRIDGRRHGALLVFDGAELCRGEAGAPRATIFHIADQEVNELGAKRRQCATEIAGHPVVVMGAYTKLTTSRPETAVVIWPELKGR